MVFERFLFLASLFLPFPSRSLSNTYTHPYPTCTEGGDGAATIRSVFMQFEFSICLARLALRPGRSIFSFFLRLMFYWRKPSVHLAFPPTAGLPLGRRGNSSIGSGGRGDGLLLPKWCWHRRAIPVAWGKCICLRLNGCSYCLLISQKPFCPLLQPLWHLRLFTCIVFFPFAPLPPSAPPLCRLSPPPPPQRRHMHAGDGILLF